MDKLTTTMGMFEKFSCSLPTNLMKGCSECMNKVPSDPKKLES
jgi:hypothetical protein